MQQELYVINHVSMITGFTDRTIRSYIAGGMLKGEKINGMWHFTPEDVKAFIDIPSVRAKIHSKNNGMIYDFLSDKFKKEDKACLILDLPCADAQKTMKSITSGISNGNFTDIEFTFEMLGTLPRFILKGSKSEVLSIAAEYL